jgi:RHS repeat-associated protein
MTAGGQVWTFDPGSPGAPAPEQLRGINDSFALACPSTHECVVSGTNNGTFDPTSPCTKEEAGLEEEEPPPCEKELTPKSGPGCEELLGCEEGFGVDGPGPIACPSLTQCTVVGSIGLEATFDPTVAGGEEPHTIDTTGPPDGAGSTLQDVACPSVTRCVAIDLAGNEITFNPQSPASAKLSSLDLKFSNDEDLASGADGIACPSITQCTVVSATGEVVEFNPASPGSPVPAVIEPADPPDLSAVACPSASSCTAVGFNHGGMSATTFDPGAPETATTTVLPTDEELDAGKGVACPSTTLCVAIAGALDAFIGSAESSPSSTAPPRISGTDEEGQTLTEEHGSWTGHPTSFTYQWESCNGTGGECAPIEDATSQTYALGPQDVGHTIRVQETASNEAGSSEPATSEPTAVVQPESSQAGPSPDEQGGAPNESEMPTTCSCGQPVNTATGVLWHTFTDAQVPGLGIPLDFTRTYTSSGATVAGPLGYGWTDSYEMHLSFDAKGNASIAQEDSAVVSFAAKAGIYQAAPGVLATLVKNVDGTYTFKRNSTNEQFVFNASGKLVSEIDRHGYKTELTYNGAGELTNVTDQAGRTLTLGYTGGRLASITDPLGHTTTFEYDSAGDLVKTTDPLGRSWRFTYDAQHRLLTMTDPNGGVTTSTYDSTGRVIKQIDPAGRVLTFSYSGANRTAAGGTTTVTDSRGLQTQYGYENEELTSVTFAAGTAEAATTSYQYDPATLGQTSITDAEGKTTTNTYDARGDLLSATDPLGKTTKYTYDGEGDLLTRTDPLGVTTTNTYDASGNLLTSSTPLSGGGAAVWAYTYGTGAQVGDRLSASNPDGETTDYTYDAEGDQASIADPLANKTTMTYDSDGRLLTRTNPSGVVTTNVYDAGGELTKTTDPLVHSTTYTYDANGNRTSTTDANGHTTTYRYDPDDELIQTTQPDGSTANTGYDADGNLVSQTDGNGHTTSYSFNGLNQTASSTDPDGRTTKYTHDGVGNLLTEVNPSGQTTTYSYDADRRITAIAYSDGTTPAVHETYDADGRRTSLTDGTGTSSFAYDNLGRLTSETNGAGATSSYTYDPAGNITQITYPNGKTVSRTYDADSRLKEITDWLGNRTTYSYDGDGNPTAEHLPGTVTAQSTYNAADQLTGITDSNADGNLATFTYARDPVGAITSSSTTGAVTSTDSYSYDAESRITADNATSYAYDAAGNPTSFNGQPQRFDAADQLLSTGSSSTSGSETGGETGGGETEPGGGTTSGGGSRSGGGSTTPAPPVEQDGVAASHASSPAPVTIAATAKTHSASKRGTLAAGPLTTNSPNELLLALVSAQGPIHGQHVRGISGGGLHWSLVTETASPKGASSIWQARVPHPLAHTTFTATLAKTGYSAMLDVLAFAPGTSLGPAAKRSGAHSAPSLSLKASSAATILAVAHDAGPAHARNPLVGNHIADQALGAKHDGTSWALTAPGGTPAIGLGGPKSPSWSLAAVALMPAATTARVGPTHGTSAARPSLASAAAPSSGAAALNTTLMAGVKSSISAPAQSATPQIASPAAGETTYTYNPEGDRTAIIAPAATATLHYDQANRLTAVDEDIRYSYNGDGLRMSKTVPGETTAFAWDESHELPLLLQSGNTSYIYGPAGQPAEQITGSTATYLLSDQSGGTRLITDSAGTLLGTYTYNAWGSVTEHTGTATTNLQYDGQYTDSETGYQYLRGRYYDPATGQLLTRDPLVAVTHDPYTYTEDDPLNRVDETGMCWQEDLKNWAEGLPGQVAQWWAGSEASAAYDFSHQQYLRGLLEYLPGVSRWGPAFEFASSTALTAATAAVLNYFSVNEQRLNAYLSDFPALVLGPGLPVLQPYLRATQGGPITDPGLAPPR